MLYTIIPFRTQVLDKLSVQSLEKMYIYWKPNTLVMDIGLLGGVFPYSLCKGDEKQCHLEKNNLEVHQLSEKVRQPILRGILPLQ